MPGKCTRMGSGNFNYANRLNPLKYNIPIFYHRFTAIKTKTVKSLKSGNDEE